MTMTTTALNGMLAAFGGAAVYASIHTGDPGSTGASEVAGGSYARQLITWGTPAGAAMAIVGSLTFQIPAGNTITHFGLWTAAGVFQGGNALASPQTFVVGAPYVLTLSASAAGDEVQEWTASTTYAAGQELTHLGAKYRVALDHTSPVAFVPSANLLLIDAPIVGCPIASGTYVCPVGLASTSTSATLGNGQLRVAPWYLPHDTTLAKIAAEVTTIGDAGSKFRMGIYADTGAYVPGALIVDAGQILGDSATVQELTINTALAAGIYWIGGAVQAVTVTQPTMRTVTLGNAPVGVTALPAANQGAAAWSRSGVTGALPDPFGTASVSGAQPRLFLKAA